MCPLYKGESLWKWNMTWVKNCQKWTNKVCNPTIQSISDWMVQLPSSQLHPFKRYTSPPLPLHTVSVQREWVMVSWLWTKIIRFQHKRYVNLLIFKFLIECCNSWVAILSRSRDTVTKNWSFEPYTRLYIVEFVTFDVRGVASNYGKGSECDSQSNCSIPEITSSHENFKLL